MPDIGRRSLPYCCSRPFERNLNNQLRQGQKKAMSPLGVGGPRLKGEDSMQEDSPWKNRRFALSVSTIIDVDVVTLFEGQAGVSVAC